jgi:hypothetical protein
MMKGKFPGFLGLCDYYYYTMFLTVISGRLREAGRGGGGKIFPS